MTLRDHVCAGYKIQGDRRTSKTVVYRNKKILTIVQNVALPCQQTLHTLISEKSTLKLLGSSDLSSRRTSGGIGEDIGSISLCKINSRTGTAEFAQWRLARTIFLQPKVKWQLCAQARVPGNKRGPLSQGGFKRLPCLPQRRYGTSRQIQCFTAYCGACCLGGSHPLG